MRAGIYLFYDTNGIVDGYVDYFLKELKTVVDYLVVVVNGKLTPEGRKKFSVLADNFFVRENVGYDVTGYKIGIEYIGWDTLNKYDELVIANSSIYGPIFPFQQTFDYMDTIECDFWGMFTTYEDKNIKSWYGIPLKWGYKPEALLSNFCVYKSSVLHSFEFRNHWETLPSIKEYFEACIYHEWAISQNLSDAGFVFAAADQAAFRTKCPSPTVQGAYEMIVDYHVPVIRKKAFFDPNGTLDYCTDIPRKIMKYLEEQTGYDCNLIWENLLRTVNQYDLKNWFNWNTILPSDYLYPYRQPHNKKIAVIFHNYYTDIMEQYLHNIESFPDESDFYFTTDTEPKREALMALMAPYEKRFHMEFRLVENRGRDVSALLVACRDVVLEGKYDLICFMHDKKAVGNRVGSSSTYIGKYYSDCCFENIAPTTEYVNNVINLFQKNPRLGIAVPPPPRNVNYYQTIGGGWGRKTNFSNTEQLLKELNIRVPMDIKKPPIAPYGTVFWFRPVALFPLFEKNWEYDDFDAEPAISDGVLVHAIERGYSLVAQGRGYYPSIIMSTTYAEQEVTRMTEIAHTYVDLTLQYVGPKAMLTQATTRFVQLLQGKKSAAPARSAAKLQPPVPSLPVLSSSRPNRGPLESFVRGICPIGLWNLMRRTKCALYGGIYVEPKVQRGWFKTAVRACMPRFLWDQLRKSKCKENGWVFVPED